MKTLFGLQMLECALPIFSDASEAIYRRVSIRASFGTCEKRFGRSTHVRDTDVMVVDALAYAELIAVGISDRCARFEQANVSPDVDNSMGKDVSTGIHLHQTLFFLWLSPISR